MTQAPYPNDPRYSVPPGDPIPYAVPFGYPGVIAGPPRPAGVTVLAVLGIIGGLILLFGGAVTLAGVILAPAANPLLRDATFFYWSAIDGVLRLVTGAALLASCIGAFTLKPWARRWMIMGATLLTVLTLGDILLTVGWIAPLLENRPATYGRRSPLMDPDIMMTVGVVKWALAIGYATAVCIILNKQAAKAVFSTIALPAAPAAPGSYLPAFPPGYPPPSGDAGSQDIGAGPPAR